MGDLYLIDEERRKVIGDQPDGEDRREEINSAILKEYVDSYFTFLQSKYCEMLEYIKDKEKKKLWIIGGSYAVFSLITTVIVNIFTRAPVNLEKIFSIPSIVLFSLFVFGVVLIYTSIIKYILTLKADCIIATRQLNCLRRAINSVLYSFFEKKFPNEIDSCPNEIRSGTIKDLESGYWKYFGQHDKYPSDNEGFRTAYNKPSIYFLSADIYSVIVISIFSSLLIITPFSFLLANISESSSNLTAIEMFFLGGVSTVALLMFITLVVLSFYFEMKRIRRYLKPGQPFDQG